MTVRDVVLPLPEDLYVRLEQTARATRQSLTELLLRSVRAGSPPIGRRPRPNSRPIWPPSIVWATTR